jgi:hypothetical protein
MLPDQAMVHASLGRWLRAQSAEGSPLSPRGALPGGHGLPAFPPALLWAGSALVYLGPLLIVLQARALPRS